MLWQRLHALGIQGRLLHAIKSMYDVGVDMAIKLTGGILDPIHASIGVKQGCPLSPTLFGLYIEDLETYVKSHHPAAGPFVDCAPNVHMSLLMYADDTAILANSASELQNLIECMDDWCVAHGMTISVKKTEVVVFNGEEDPLPGTWHLRGTPLTISKVFKYLGVWFHYLEGAAHGLQKAASRGKLAIACLHRKLADLDVGSNVCLTLHLYSSIALPALLYGCEIWGPGCMKVADPACSNNEAEVVHRNFIKFTLRVRRCTKAWIAYRESGMYPLQYTCLQRMLAFSNRVLALDDREYIKLAMQDCIADAQLGRNNWASQVNKLVKHVSGGTNPHTLHPANAHTDVDICLSSWRKHYHTCVWRGLAPEPRLAPSRNVTLCCYNAWFAINLPDDDTHWAPAHCITAQNIPYSHLMSLLKLRTNSHDLAIDRLRRARPSVPRANRLCTWCNIPTAVQDEHHCVLECPNLAQQRLQYQSALQHGSMHQIFTDPNNVGPLAAFVHHHIVNNTTGNGL
jgi:Reverse transcriptase (RNA-dependent DNA polymerase)